MENHNIKVWYVATLLCLHTNIEHVSAYSVLRKYETHQWRHVKNRTLKEQRVKHF